MCRFLTRLLLVHGSLSAYRLSRLIKYSFYKNIAFGFLLFYYQFYCGFSGQSMVDDISAAAFNVVFTSIPILLFAVLDRPVHNLNTLLRFPQARSYPSPFTSAFGNTASVAGQILTPWNMLLHFRHPAFLLLWRLAPFDRMLQGLTWN